MITTTKVKDNIIACDKQMSKPQKIIDYGAEWFLGPSNSKPLQTCLSEAQEKGNKFIVAFDYCTDNGVTKVYGSYKNAKRFWKETKTINVEDRCFYVVVPTDTPCCLYADLEWDLSWKSIQEISDKFVEVVQETLELVDVRVPKENFLFATASEISTNKGSLHVHVPNIFFTGIEDQKRFFNAVKIKLDTNDEWSFIDQTDKSYILKSFIDFGVYNKNRQIRLPYSSKRSRKDGIGKRPLIPFDGDSFDITEWAITDISNCDEEPVNISRFPEEISCTKRNVWSKELVNGILESQDLDVTVDTFRGNNLIALKNKSSKRICPINHEENKSDNAYIVIRDNKLHYHCHDEGCKGQSVVIHTFDQKNEVLLDEPPFKKYYWDFTKNRSKYIKDSEINYQTFSPFLKRMIHEINKYCVVISGSSRPYVLYRICEHKKNSQGRRIKCVSYKAQFFEAFTSSYKQYNVKFGGSFILGPSVWQNHPLRHQKIEEECRPYASIQDVPHSVFNTYNGLAISREDAFKFGKSDPTRLVNFILNAWCQNDTKVCDWVLNWMAHLIQKP